MFSCPPGDVAPLLIVTGCPDTPVAVTPSDVVARETALVKSRLRSSKDDVLRSEELRLRADPPANSREIVPSSDARVPVPGGSKCVDDRSDTDRIDELRDGMEGNVSMAGGAVNMVDCEPVDVRDRMEGTERMDGTGDKDLVKGVGDEE